MKLLLISLFFLTAPAFASGLIAEDEMVVVLHSYSRGNIWTDSIDNGVRTTLLSKLFAHQISSEYLDTKRYIGDKYLDSLLETYKVKLKGKKVKAFITSDDNAFHFAISLRKKLNVDTPIFFSGVNGYLNYKETILKTQKNITGIVESLPLKENIELILKTHANLKKVYFINTIHSASGRFVKKEFQKVVNENNFPLEFIYLENLKMQDVYDLSKDFDESSVALFGAYSRDSEGKYYHFTENMRNFSRHSSRPVYAFFDFFLNHGVIGGVFLSGYDHGKMAAEMTLKYISGTPIDDLKIVSESPIRTYFDFNVLKKFGMTSKDVESSATIVNSPFGIKYFYKNFPQLFWLTITSLIFLTFSIIFLAIILKNKISFERKIIDLNRTLEDRVESRTQQLLEQQDVLVTSARLASVGEMASSIAHEINNPLAIIQMLSKKIQRGLGATSEQASFLKMDETIARISKIVKSLKLISRDDKGVDFEDICLEDIIRETINFSESRFKNAGIIIKNNIHDSRTYINANSVQISQVLINLLNNSYDAISDNEEKWVKVDLRHEIGFVSLIVTDSGQIKDKTICDKMMDPFFTTKAVGKGTGLGLSISKNIINKHEGDLYLDKLCVNTSFVITLPLAEAPHSKNVSI
ncbi:ABC transporter substrate binding protein [Halobacteriovorax sp. HLS]|uniref:sensor histidine kinase n=1 Tax=Halobacteriovorax sp. HLS TaxID=2234000 RepID=UPI000FD70B1E|nr:ABC transporter substrate binding protein [Halobacteriovorax sp. HLS]